MESLFYCYIVSDFFFFGVYKYVEFFNMYFVVLSLLFILFRTISWNYCSNQVWKNQIFFSHFLLRKKEIYSYKIIFVIFSFVKILIVKSFTLSVNFNEATQFAKNVFFYFSNKVNLIRVHRSRVPTWFNQNDKKCSQKTNQGERTVLTWIYQFIH